MKTNWSGHLIGHPLVGRRFRWRHAPVGSAARDGRVEALRLQGDRVMLHFAHALAWYPLDECDPLA